MKKVIHYNLYTDTHMVKVPGKPGVFDIVLKGTDIIVNTLDLNEHHRKLTEEDPIQWSMLKDIKWTDWP